MHPNDHVNRGQSSNDTFPTAMHIAVVSELHDMYPRVRQLRDTLDKKAKEFDDVIMVGRTHLQDATPIRLGQVISGWVAQIDFALDGIEYADTRARELAIGGTAVGTGLNAHPRRRSPRRRASSSSRPTTCSPPWARTTRWCWFRARCASWPTPS